MSRFDCLNQKMDVAIIGAGVNGVGIARELAMRGISCVVIDKGDISNATSSCSSKLVHGGLRYLEMGQFKLVFQACVERYRLLKNAPHLVKKLSFLLPVYKHDKHPLWKLKIGLTLYHLFSFFHRIGKPRFLTKKEVLDKEPWIASENLEGGAIYQDAQMDDARICVELMMQAAQYGAKLLNYCEVEGCESKADGYTLLVKDVLTNKPYKVEATAVLNITGPWSDELLKVCNLFKKQGVSLSKGCHVITKRLTQQHALVQTSPIDGRVFFIIPWGAYSLIGTTDSALSSDLDSEKVLETEVDYLIESASHFFKQIKLTRDDVMLSFWGVRPLLFSEGQSLVSISREHQLIKNDKLFFSLVGGKYTTFRSVSEQVALKVCSALKRKVKRSLTKDLPFVGGEIECVDEYVEKNYEIESKIYPLSKPIYISLVRRYGNLYDDVLSVVFQKNSYQDMLTETSYLKGEVVYAIRHEYALTIVDFMRRRSSLFFQEDGGLSCLDEVSQLFANELNWDNETLKNQKAEYVSFLKADITRV